MRKERMVNNILIGCGQITWIRFTPTGIERLASPEQILHEIAQAGYDGAPAGPDEERTAEQLLDLYRGKGLLPAPGYLGTAFWDRARTDEILGRVRQHARFAQAVGCTELYVAPGGFDYRTRSGKTRRETAGHVQPEDALSDDEYAVFGDTLNRAGELALEHGVRICFHNHVGTVIETREEIDRLMALTDPALVFLGPDTGHLAWAGADPVAFFRDYAPRIKTVHLKDIDAAVRDRGHQAGWSYETFTDHGVFQELGEGCVDFPALFDILGDAAFTGWLIVETDVTQKPTALDSITISRHYLRGLGY
jgi:inosose dehydratase